MERSHDLDGLIKLSFFADIGKAITAESSIHGVLDRVMEHIGLYFAPLNWSLLLLDTESEELVFKLVVGRSADKLQGVRISANEGVAGWVLDHGAPCIIEDVENDRRFSDNVDKMSGFKTESIIAVPLHTARGVFGVIELINKLDHSHFTAFDLNVLSTIADFAAIAIEKAYYLAATRRLAMTDSLTGVLNRRGLAKIVDKETERAKRYGGGLAVILADVDGFKKINDERGHLAGDEVLKTIGKALKKGVREVDSVARLGGDEFLVLMPNTDQAAGELARERIAEILQDAALSCPAGRFSVTLGLHVSSEIDFNEIVRKSDRDLYRRKDQAASMSMERHLIHAIDDEVYPAKELDD